MSEFDKKCAEVLELKADVLELKAQLLESTEAGWHSLRIQRDTLKADVDKWKTATGLVKMSGNIEGDPADIEPEHLEEYIATLTARVAELEQVESGYNKAIEAIKTRVAKSDRYRTALERSSKLGCNQQRQKHQRDDCIISDLTEGCHRCASCIATEVLGGGS